MSLFTREARSIDSDSVFGSDYVTPLGAGGVTRLAPVYGAVSLIADLFSLLPMTVVRRRGDGQGDPVPTPLFLADPDPFLSPSAWRYQLVVSLKLRGNAFGLVDPGRRYCRWLNPDSVQIDERDPAKPLYRVGEKALLPVKQGGNLLHVREFVQPGKVRGLSPIEAFMDVFEGANLAAAYGRKWFRNAAIPPAILQSKGTRTLGPDVLRQARDDFMAATAEGKPVALPGEWDYTRISVNPAEAQFLETIEASATTIATIFRVPAEDIGGKAGNSRTYSNREMDAELFNVRTLMPLGNRAGEAFAEILPATDSVTWGYDVLAQPGQLESARADSEELRNGTLTLAEARRRRGRTPLTADEIEDWQSWYSTTKSQSESIAEAITKESA